MCVVLREFIVGSNFLGCFIDEMFEFLHIEAIVSELGMCPALGMMTLVLRMNQISLLPGAVANATQSGQVLVAIGILAVVQLNDAGPVWQEEQVGQASAMHAYEYIRVPGNSQLFGEGEPKTE